MALVKEQILSLFMFVVIGLGCCQAAIYKVGDSAGWALIGNVDYNAWASSKTFQVGDTLVFEYDPRYHDVLEVSRSDFHMCDATGVIATYVSGNDSITIQSPGHYYYICGFAGHCQTGQKVDIRVLDSIQPVDIHMDRIESPVQVLNVSSDSKTPIRLSVHKTPIGLLDSLYCNGSVSRRFYGLSLTALLLVLTCVVFDVLLVVSFHFKFW